MTAQDQDRLFGAAHAFDHPATVGLTAGIVGVVLAAPVAVWLLGRAGRLAPKPRAELAARCRSWVWLTAAVLPPVLLGAAWTILGVGVLGLLCYREYARATGLFRERAVSGCVAAGVVAVTLAALDHWYGLFAALVPLTVGLIAAVAVLADRPAGYIQRVALGVFGFALFGTGLGHLGYLANDPGYRPVVLLVLVGVELNDVFAFLAGKGFGRRKLAPHTSPNKTVGGAAGALVLTTLLVAAVAGPVFRGSPLDTPAHRLALGVLVSVLGQFGDLVLSSVKRDLGVKDMAATLPGHGGLLDRFDSLLLVAPAVFHYVNYVAGVGAGRSHVLTGG